MKDFKMYDRNYFLNKLDILIKENKTTQMKAKCRTRIINFILPIIVEFPNDGLSNEDKKFIIDWFNIDKKYFITDKFPEPLSDNGKLLHVIYFFIRNKNYNETELKNNLDLKVPFINDDYQGKIYFLLSSIMPEKCSCNSGKYFRYKDYESGFYKSCSKLCSHTTELKEKTSIEKYGKRNVAQVDEFKEKAKQTSVERYGDTNYMKTEEGKKYFSKLYYDKTGYKFPFSNPEIIAKCIKTNIEKHETDYIPRKHLSNEIIEKLDSKEFIENELQSKSIKTISDELCCHASTLYRRIKKYGIEHKQFNKKEEEIKLFLEYNNVNFIQNDRQQIKPKELDFYLPDYNLAIEFNGLYWHSDIFKENDYHLNKYLACKEKGIRLISINEDEWNNKSDIIKNKILSLLGKSEKGLPARNLHISEITSSEANDFCEKYHIQGKTSAIIYSIGAFDENNILIGIMSFSKQRTTGDIELIRFCHDGKIHNGLFSKMLKYSINHNTWNTIISFADLRYSDGNLYKRTGFVEECVIKPDYKYVYNKETFHKFNFKKDRIIKKFNLTEEYVNSKTEKELMEEQGYVRLYDIGKIKYVMKL